MRVSQKLFDAWVDYLEANSEIRSVARRVPEETRSLMRQWSLEYKVRCHHGPVDRDAFFAEMKEGLGG